DFFLDGFSAALLTAGTATGTLVRVSENFPGPGTSRSVGRGSSEVNGTSSNETLSLRAFSRCLATTVRRSLSFVFLSRRRTHPTLTRLQAPTHPPAKLRKPLRSRTRGPARPAEHKNRARENPRPSRAEPAAESLRDRTAHDAA